MNVISIQPKFGVNYDIGYAGFTFVGGAVSDGIAYFERWSRLSDIKVSHALTVSGPNECIEAHMGEGVARAPLSKYFDDPTTQIFFRKPKPWNLSIAHNILLAAASKIGCKYATDLIIAEAAANSLAGHLINEVLHDEPNRVVSDLLADPNAFICSQLVAYALGQQPELKGRGILANPFDTITPQQLFEDPIIFEDWVNASGHGPTLNTIRA